MSTRGYGRQVGPYLRKVACQPQLARNIDERRLERETGIEPATNSLEGCDSTTELLPPSSVRAHRPCRLPSTFRATLRRNMATFRPPPRRFGTTGTNGGEGRIRTSEAARATDLQSAAFDRFATSPMSGGIDADSRALALRSASIVPGSHVCPIDSPTSREGPSNSPPLWNNATVPLDVGAWGEARNLELAKGFEPPTG